MGSVFGVKVVVNRKIKQLIFKGLKVDDRKILNG
jgi:hypothetical protein